MFLCPVWSMMIRSLIYRRQLIQYVSTDHARLTYDQEGRRTFLLRWEVPLE